MAVLTKAGITFSGRQPDGSVVLTINSSEIDSVGEFITLFNKLDQETDRAFERPTLPPSKRGVINTPQSLPIRLTLTKEELESGEALNILKAAGKVLEDLDHLDSSDLRTPTSNLQKRITAAQTKKAAEDAAEAAKADPLNPATGTVTVARNEANGANPENITITIATKTRAEADKLYEELNTVGRASNGKATDKGVVFTFGVDETEEAKDKMSKLETSKTLINNRFPIPGFTDKSDEVESAVKSVAEANNGKVKVSSTKTGARIEINAIDLPDQKIELEDGTKKIIPGREYYSNLIRYYSGMDYDIDVDEPQKLVINIEEDHPDTLMDKTRDVVNDLRRISTKVPDFITESKENNFPELDVRKATQWQKTTMLESYSAMQGLLTDREYNQAALRGAGKAATKALLAAALVTAICATGPAGFGVVAAMKGTAVALSVLGISAYSQTKKEQLDKQAHNDLEKDLPKENRTKFVPSAEEKSRVVGFVEKLGFKPSAKMVGIVAGIVAAAPLIAVMGVGAAPFMAAIALKIAGGTSLATAAVVTTTTVLGGAAAVKGVQETRAAQSHADAVLEGRTGPKGKGAPAI